MLLQTILPLINTIAFDEQVELDGYNGFQIKSFNSQQILTQIMEIFSKNNIKIESITIKSPSLEEVFLDIVNDGK